MFFFMFIRSARNEKMEKNRQEYIWLPMEITFGFIAFDSPMHDGLVLLNSYGQWWKRRLNTNPKLEILPSFLPPFKKKEQKNNGIPAITRKRSLSKKNIQIEGNL